MKKQLLTAAVLVAACDKRPATEEAPERDSAETNAGQTSSAEPPGSHARVASYEGTFDARAARPVSQGAPQPVELPRGVVDELNSVAPERIEAAFLGRKLAGADVVVRFGGPDQNDGLLLTVVVGGRTASRAIPPATNAPEQVTNLDHTVERLLDELGISRQGGAL